MQFWGIISKICEVETCRKVYEGGMTSKYCDPCKVVVRKAKALERRKKYKGIKTNDC